MRNKSLGLVHTAVATATASAVEVAANTSRSFLLLENKSAIVVYYRVDGTTVTSANGITLLPGAIHTYDADGGVPSGAITMIAASGTPAVLVVTK